MKVYRNLSVIRTKEQRGRRITLGGLLILFLGLLSSFIPNWYPPTEPSANPIIHFLQFNWAYISFGALAIGFIASNIGSYYINRFAARRWPGTKQIARPDELLERSLKGFDDKYSLFLWSLPQSNYLLAGPSGIYLFSLKGDKGKVTVEGDRWREAFSIGRFFTAFTREGLGNPSRELQEEMEQVRVLLQQGEAGGELTFDTADVPIQPAAIFINPQVQLTANNPSIPVMTTGDVKKLIREGKGRTLNALQTRELTDFLKNKSVIGAAE
ncbi:hypothetical protein GC175_19530 [bacterium]|nr:hypothetical protein [bacterium]